LASAGFGGPGSYEIFNFFLACDQKFSEHLPLIKNSLLFYLKKKHEKSKVDIQLPFSGWREAQRYRCFVYSSCYRPGV
jgi:hypothetical protein